MPERDPQLNGADPLESRSDEELALLAASDRTAFRTLYRRYVDRMFSFFAWKFGRDDAPDLTSEVFVRALKAASQFGEGRSWPAWLYGIARNVASEHLRKRNRRQRPLEPDVTAHPDDDLVDDELRREVRLAIEKLPERQREVVELRFWADLSYRDISAVTGRSETALRAQLHRAVVSLRPLFEESSNYENDIQTNRDSGPGPARSVPEQG